MSERMPVLFLGHGSPLNCLVDNDFTRGWAAVGESMPKPKAILCVSAHWYIPDVKVTIMPDPRTIHDFSGFPKALYEMDYPAPGSPELADKIIEILKPVNAKPDIGWGIDHGAWSVLCHLFPDADIPVVQLSINNTEEAAFHYELGKLLAPLRDEGVLILGSGNVVHNIGEYDWSGKTSKPFPWAEEFEKFVREKIINHDDQALIEFEKAGQAALLSVPTPDHYLPLLYITALRNKGEKAEFVVEGFDGGSMSMLGIKIG
ncbi:MAG: 4,5-DOPA dioxygenase extradiol [Firmicutes bacterium]|nr:4,5-DOPA dioxygenase extradiol [Bacillota bacterium]